ncbi:MAG: hypothetical protein WC343_08655 [Bacilli bacterium]|jgi:hypothetical protein
MKRVLLLLILLLLIAPAAAQITAEVGETWIRFDWPLNSSNGTVIIVDGVEQGSADGKSMYYLTDLNPNEEHQITLIDTAGAAVDAARVRTLSPLSTVLFFVAIELILALLCLTMQDPVRVVLVGALGSVLGLFLFGLTIGHGALWLIVLALVGFQALFVILALYNLLSDALDWW